MSLVSNGKLKHRLPLWGCDRTLNCSSSDRIQGRGHSRISYHLDFLKGADRNVWSVENRLGRQKRGGSTLRHPEIRNCICRLESAGDVVKCIWDIAVFQTDLLIILHTSVEERKLDISSKKIPDYFSKETGFSSMAIFWNHDRWSEPQPGSLRLICGKLLLQQSYVLKYISSS